MTVNKKAIGSPNVCLFKYFTINSENRTLHNKLSYFELVNDAH